MTVILACGKNIPEPYVCPTTTQCLLSAFPFPGCRYEKLWGAVKASDPATGGSSRKMRVVTIMVLVLWELLEPEKNKWTNLISLKHLNRGSFFCFPWLFPPVHTYTLVHPSLAVWIRKPHRHPVIQQSWAKDSFLVSDVPHPHMSLRNTLKNEPLVQIQYNKIK